MQDGAGRPLVRVAVRGLPARGVHLATARGQRWACLGWPDPRWSGDVLPCVPPQSSAQEPLRRPWPPAGFLCCVPIGRHSVRHNAMKFSRRCPPVPGGAARGEPRRRARVPSRGRRSRLGPRAHVPELSDAEHQEGRGRPSQDASVLARTRRQSPASNDRRRRLETPLVGLVRRRRRLGMLPG